MEKLANYINGSLQEPCSGNYIDNVNPAIGEVYSLIPDSDEEDLSQAVEAAQFAFPSWSALSAADRSKILLNISDKILENFEALAEAESVDNGKPLILAKKLDIPRAAENFRFFAYAITQFSSESHPMGTQAINYTLRSPIGIVGCISPWNLPLYLFTWKIAPALATGNCVIAKPSEVTPMTAYLLSKICMEAELPAGVLNIIHGYGHRIGNALVSHPKVKAISFTGSSKTGSHIASIAAPQFKKLSLELGGKNPAIIFADCDWDLMMDNALRLSFSNQGQICLCGSRLFIEHSIYDQFKTEFVKRTEALQVGDPYNQETNQGAVVSEAHMKKILYYIDLAKAEGGTILTGGQQVQVSGRCAKGYFVKPTVIENLLYDCRTNQEEIFGPVVTLAPFENENEVLRYANSTQYGLSATVWSKDVNKCHRIAAKLESGIVWVNTWLLRDLRTPFGGMKSSGVGREGGLDALRFFTESKNVCVSISS